MSIDIHQKRIYRHFKGNYYVVEAVAKDANTEELIVVYRNIYDYQNLWTRTAMNFLEEIEVDREDNTTGQSTRFELVDKIV